MTMDEHLILPGEIMMILMSIFGHFIALNLAGHGAQVHLFSRSPNIGQRAQLLEQPGLVILLDGEQNLLASGRSRHRGKTSFVQHRTLLHLYHSFHCLWIFLFMMFQQRYYLGWGMYERPTDFIKLLAFDSYKGICSLMIFLIPTPLMMIIAFALLMINYGPYADSADSSFNAFDVGSSFNDFDADLGSNAFG
ncbi:hypothetical protein HHK36_033445 [Tetracentron sinense]|uniref:Uncharacterized protein n=1 Tax=Tetracentron sinense TaxID=13715 RepID=A0A834Y6H5_TETSI|nr:hypothetical protein HHK36_033445 [Tetracentron sinense]